MCPINDCTVRHCNTRARHGDTLHPVCSTYEYSAGQLFGWVVVVVGVVVVVVIVLRQHSVDVFNILTRLNPTRVLLSVLHMGAKKD